MATPDKHIISASRRTDLPAYYLDRLIAWIEDGVAEVVNPYSGAVSSVSLDPDTVHTMVLWSKNFGPFLDHDRSFNDYRLYFLYTLNDMPGLEPSIPPLEHRLATMAELAARYRPERIGWRFDPIAFTPAGPVTEIDRFIRIAEAVASAGITRLIISFLDFYGKVRTRNDNLGLGLTDPPDAQKQEYAGALAESASTRGFTVEACCEDLGGIEGIAPASCIDGARLSALAGVPAPTTRDRGQRTGCQCTKSRDIGSYRDMPCPAGCRYCYANPLISQPAGGAG